MTGIEAEMIGRRLALHLRKNHFEGCHIILDYEEKKLLNGGGAPKAIAELNLPLRHVNFLEKAGYVYIDDMVGMDVFSLEKDLSYIGPKGAVLIGKVVSDALRELRAEETKTVGGETNG